ncbi:hypothetical protein BC938DRAFT_476716 [Jimgerdemannia flammicorona]|uniref:Uncharacterized protein n=1 Tax=Jimgerdemannia flammicorona TaxID=994334 RepID=A0A433PEW2_9FUNG|nr:hypothetical protein BC938DRAFT_476716 [Jimgerdemannia flammicorona]
MIFGGYSLDVLVDNQPLAEYWEESSEDRLVPSPSYVYNHVTKQKLLCNRHCYAAVKHPSTDFTIRYASPSAAPNYIICAMLYIDGKSDNVWIPLDGPRAYTQDSFYSEGRDKRHMFRFGVTLWSGDEDGPTGSAGEGSRGGDLIIPFANRASAYGTPGCITVVFYWASRKAVAGPGDAILATSRDSELKQPTLQESKMNHDKKITVAFDEFVVNTTPLRRDYEKVIPEPVAVLHLHYRAEPILRNRGHAIPLEIRRRIDTTRTASSRASQDDDDDNASGIYLLPGGSSSIRPYGRAVTPPQRDVKPLLLTVDDSDDESSPSRRRPPPEVIVLSDSDDDDDDAEQRRSYGNNEDDAALLAKVKTEPISVTIKRERVEEDVLQQQEMHWKRIKTEPQVFAGDEIVYVQPGGEDVTVEYAWGEEELEELLREAGSGWS